MNNKTPLIIVIILLILVIFGLGGYIAYEKLFIKSEAEECKTVIDDVSIDINKLYKIEDTLNNLDKSFNVNEGKFFGYIYNFKELNIKDFDKTAAIYTSIYSELIRSNEENSISSERVKNKYEKIFGKELNYIPSSINLDDKIVITYDDSNKIYKYKAATINNDHKDEYLVGNTKTKLSDDLVTITRKVFYVMYNDSFATIYTDASKGTRLGEVKLKTGEVNESEVIAKYGSKLNTYNFTFKLGTDDEYKLYRIERTK